MTTLQLHRIQHSLFTVLVFHIQFSSLPLLSLGYSLPDKYFINCGSDINVSMNGKVYVGESNPGHPAATFIHSTKKSIQSSVHSLYQTARFFQSQSWYEFSIDNNGTYLLRLHFYAFSSPNNPFSPRFKVSVHGFSLLQNFDAGNDIENISPLVKEFAMYMTPGGYKVTFTPLPSSFAFVNAIELFILPLHLIDDQVARFTYTATDNALSSYNGLLSRVLETIHRLNVGGKTVSRSNDGLLRKWTPDDTYLINPRNALNSSYNAQIQYYVPDDYDGPNSNRFTAPSDVYGTAKVINNGSADAAVSDVSNITWGLPVDKNTDHLLRFHFCDFLNPQNGLTIFTLLIYDSYVVPVNDDGNVTNQLPAPYYYDLVVRSDHSGLMKVSVLLNASFAIAKPNAFLNGLEIMKLTNSSDLVMKLTNSSDLVPSDLVKSKHHHLLVVLGSALGGLVFVAAGLLGLLWCLKIRKQKPDQNSDWLPIPITEESSHGTLTEGTERTKL